MVGYWSAIVLLCVLMCYNLICAIRDYELDNKLFKVLSRIVLIFILGVVVLNSLFRILDLGLEIPFIF